MVDIVRLDDGSEILKYRDKSYTKSKGRAYLSHWKCVNRVEGCDAEIVFKELKGGSIKVVKCHFNKCITP